MSSVSIIIPNYNHTRFLEESLRSALNQSLPALEIIVIDDGSTDNCREVVDAFGERVRYIYQENQGLAGARNTGIKTARGDLIGLLDADDQWLPSFLEEMIALGNDHPHAAAYYCQAQCVDENGEELPQILGGPPVADAEELYWKLLRANFIIPSTTLIHRERLLEAGLFDQSLRSCEDWDLWLRLLPEHEVIGTESCLVRYRIHGSSLSTDPSGMQTATRAVISKHFGMDDAKPTTWSDEKRRAYGGVYRYHLLTCVQRQNNWKDGLKYLGHALKADPTLAKDLDLFYDLALGTQEPGYRGSCYQLNLEDSEKQIRGILVDLFRPPMSLGYNILQGETCGTAYYALGLVAYNIGQRHLSRHYFMNALHYRPELWHERGVIENLIKSYFSREFLNKIKHLFRSKELSSGERKSYCSVDDA